MFIRCWVLFWDSRGFLRRCHPFSAKRTPWGGIVWPKQIWRTGEHVNPPIGKAPHRLASKSIGVFPGAPLPEYAWKMLVSGAALYQASRFEDLLLLILRCLLSRWGAYSATGSACIIKTDMNIEKTVCQNTRSHPDICCVLVPLFLFRASGWRSWGVR